MKSGASLALAVGLGVASVCAYWILARAPAVTGNQTSQRVAASPPEGGRDTIIAPSTARVVPDTQPAPIPRAAPTRDSPLSRELSALSGLARMQRLLAIAAEADEEALPQLWNDASAIADMGLRRDALQALLTRWFELAPDSAPRQLLDATLRKPKGTERSEHLAAIAQAWAVVDPQAAWTYGAGIDEGSARVRFQHAMLSAWVERDPDRALVAVMGLPSGWQKDELMRRSASALVRVDPARALQQAGAIKQADGRKLLSAVIDSWSEHDPAGAAQWLAANPGRTTRVLQQIAARYGAVDPRGALAWGAKVDRNGSMGVAGQILGAYAEENPEEALQMALALDGRQRANALTSVLTAIAQRDPQLALANMDKLPARGGARAMVAHRIAAQLMADPRAALEWARELDDMESRSSAVATVGSELAASDPDAAAALTSEVPIALRDDWIAQVAAGYAKTDKDKAIRWLRSYIADPASKQMASALLTQLSAIDDAAAAEAMMAIPDVAMRDRAIQEMMMRSGFSEPEVAVKWLDRMTDPMRRGQAVSMLAQNWAQQDFPSARRWANSLGAGPVRDQALSSIISGGNASLDDTLSVIGQIQSPESRTQAISQSVFRLAQSDVEAARTLLRRYPLAPDHMQGLTSSLRENFNITL